jgi:micrococcal nuclease
MSNKSASTEIIPQTTYSKLLKNIKSEITTGLEAIRRCKVVTYWNIGDYIVHNLNHHKSHANYGKGLIRRLVHDTNIDERTLHQLVKFARELPKPSARTNFNWTQYRTFLSIKDQDTRLNLIHQLKDENLTTRNLIEQIKTINVVPVAKPLMPKRGPLYTYTLINPVSDKNEKNFRNVDCGFDIYRTVPSVDLNTKPAKTVVEAVVQDALFELRSSKRTNEDLYTYAATLHHVVDGDTLVLELDLGFRTTIKQILRMRGINTPERNTPEGKKATRFVSRRIKKDSQITVRTYARDIYGRYLADIFLGAKYAYLNQELLDKGLAQRY